MEFLNTEYSNSTIIASQEEAKTALDPEAVCISQRGFGVIDMSAKNRKLGTSGLGPCISVIGYAPDQKVLTVAHIDGMTELAGSISTLAAWLEHAGVEDLSTMQFTLDGGDESSRDLRAKLIQLLREWKINHITDHNPESLWTVGERKFVVSVDDGMPTYGVMPAYPEDPETRTAKLARTQSMEKTILSPDYTDVKGKIIGLSK